MANIKPVSDLRNYNSERDQAEKALFARIAEAELRVQNGEPYMTLEELKAKLDKKRAINI